MKLAAIAQVLGCTCPPMSVDVAIDRIASIESADVASITFLSNPRFAEQARLCKASAIIVARGCAIEGKINLEVADPYLGYAKVAHLFEDNSPVFGVGISPAALIDPSARVHPTAHIGPASVIGKDCSIGEGTVIAARCVIERGTVIGAACRIDSGAVIRYDTIIGNRVIIQSGAIIGSDGFANAREKNGAWVSIPCFGRVVIEDDVQIGANTTIDRGNFEPTLIGKGTRLDNLIQIAHNVRVGEHTAMAAQVGISGSTTVGKCVLIGGQAGFAGHIEIGDNAFVGAKAGVSKSVGKGAKVTGYPARDLMGMRRIEAAQLSLPALLKEVKYLRKELDELKGDCQ
jgi:UDP-3-O-[3-hydroxymyristoyl] glucosamine N-acyltransferase